MAFQMSYTLPSGIVCPDSYWAIKDVVIEKRSKGAMITFCGFFTAGAASNRLETIGEKRYIVPDSTVFDEYFSVDGLGDLNVYARAYQYAKCCLDTNGVSFFDGATNV